ncbi:uncharacterized protein YtpQ (UPF0354 family) [Salirhabdus euzebyi]|uniref:UPF0354 protein HNQ94_000570 n=1 Tax=Salirhabdus euzebyi TaxID=394506 RepID=A0A841PTJ6_9BACI|nr:DUF1444 domain-containing protein [Salirhabdus euzebyi]MBB6452149.1 uncharacterized protein YtpQ (UPF0354 family) [Salirhabdus euzebyi]
MKMTSIKMKKMLEERLSNPSWNTIYDREKDNFRIEWKDTKMGMVISLPGVIAKWERRKEEALDELVNHIEEALRIMNEKHELTGKEKHIFPVIRSTSFPKETKNGKKLIFSEHTAETRIYYALDLGKSYKLIDEYLLKMEDWSKERVTEIAKFNVRSLPISYKKDEVAGNTFYFVATNDGYDASRILNEALLEEMKANAEGELAIAVPHQDVCIFADIKNPTGYDVLAQMTMQFFADGRIPITSLSFLYEDKGLEPIFILAKNRKKEEDK